MDHVRYAHRVPEEVQSVKLEKLIPPWTVTQKVYTESLTSRHSGISNDILLFSDIGLSLAHHYRVHKKGVPHITLYVITLQLYVPAARRRLWPVLLDRLDPRSLTDAYPGSGRHPHESHLA